ncbi:MAG: hypothetical protein CL785_01445 [Chloroflexi bacterium]|nr:hypothetical protein [Chloroflexota bacterium]
MHAYLANKTVEANLLETFYPNLNSLCWEGSFKKAYGVSSEEFLAELEQFIKLDIEEQMDILPKP